jgi:hypothetical protein
VQTTYPGQTATFNGAVTAFNGYTGTVMLSCVVGATAPPTTCTVTPSSITVPGASLTFTVTASDTVIQDFQFKVQGTDNTLPPRSALVTLKVVDFSVGAPSPSSLTVPHATSGSTTVTVSALGSFSNTVTLGCSDLTSPGALQQGATCTFVPATVTLSPGSNVAVTLNVSVPDTVPTGTYSIAISGTSGDGQTRNAPTPLSVTVTSNPTFPLTSTPASLGTAKPGQPATLTTTIIAQSQDNYAGTVNFTCSSAGGLAANACSLSPTSVTLTSGSSASTTLTVNTSGATAGNNSVTVTGTDSQDASNTQSLAVPFSIVDYGVTTSAASTTVPGGSPSTFTVSLTPLNGYSGNVAATCSVSAPLTCTLNPGGPYVVSATTVAVTATVSVPANTPAQGYAVSISTNDTDPTLSPPLTHNATATVNVQDFQVNAPTSPPPIRAGQTTEPVSIITAPLNGFSGNVTLACSGLPALSQCNFSPSGPVAVGTTITLTISTTAATALLQRPVPSRNTPLYALWLSMPGMALGFVGLARPGGKRRHGAWLGMLLLALVLLGTLVACGGGGGSSTTSPPPVPQPGTPAGTYTVTVTGTSGTVTRTAQIQLTVQ